MSDRALPSSAAVIVGAGSSTRMAGIGGVRKPFLELGGRTLLWHCCAAFAGCDALREIVLVVHEGDVERANELVAAAPDRARVRAVVPGGAERTDSVRAGVAALSDEVELVAVHDAARPLVTTELVERALRAAADYGSSVVAVPVADTIKVTSDGVHAERTLDRSVLWAAQTPQVFRVARFRELLERAHREGFRPTDDSALHERWAGPVALVEGHPSNLKITTPADLDVAEALLKGRAAREEEPR